MEKVFEIGSIRPPSEAASLMLRITRNCSWNKCKFCNLYKGQNFSTRPIEDIKADIDQIALIVNNIIDWTSSSMIPSMKLDEKLRSLPPEITQRYLHVMQWMSYRKMSVFLQDANTLVLSFDKLLEMLCYLREKLPQIKRVTSYARVDALAKFTVQELTQLREAGLDRIHAGYESGSDAVLELISKGYTKAQEIEAGQNVKASGIELSIYYMPGVGGKNLSDDNAIQTADVINKINPDFVRIRTFIPRPETAIIDDINAGLIKECTDLEKLLELKKMIENIDGADGRLYSDHIINLFEGIYGNMKTDKKKMLSVIESFEKLDVQNQRRYQAARRMGLAGSLDGMELLDIEESEMIDQHLSQYTTQEDFESFLLKHLYSYI